MGALRQAQGPMLRRGLPRVAGGDPWPPAGEVEVGDAATSTVVESSVAEAAPAAEPAPTVATAEPVEAPHAAEVAPSPSTGSAAGVTLRRGLPRTPGGGPWPPADAAQAAPVATSGAPVAATAPVAAAATATGVALRRGLPRRPGGEPWPPAGAAAAVAIEPVGPSTGSGVDSAALDLIDASDIPASAAVSTIDVSIPLPFPRTVFPGKYAFVPQSPAPEPKRYGPFTKGQWAGTVIVGGIALLGAAAMAVLFVRWLLSLSGMQDFLTTYPGEYHLPEGAPVGFPAWLGWQHFFNVFLMVLIIRSGLRIRGEKRPTAFWTPRNDPKGKVSLTIWFHQALDILWLVNGVVFIVLLFVTGQWMRVIPTSWEVIPNAFTAVLQYISLDWPTENGWVNYNSIQQIAYFVTIFIAAPLAAVTGYRMSGMWPKNAEKLNKAYPIEWARALHFPVMLYFVAFIAVHVFLVFATGALRNLNHMYAAQGSVDPNAYADNWTGFWFLVASLVVIIAAWVAARPLVLAPIAKLFGTVSSR
ncbi:cytochrome b/b6 domain-containing protein [Microbacterium sp. A204]|uniref:cytochrome b/b6 domain-containing protein n=1 Tax=Microbacterium sp. A204 TaxID=3457321 RepID=UPI003FD27E77